MRLKYVPRGSWQPNVHNMNRKRATQGRTEPLLRYHVQRCAMMCHDVPCIAEPGATSLPLGLFARGLWRGEWEEPKSQVMSALTRPWHGLDVMWTSTEKVKQKESQNHIHSPRIWGAHLQVSHGKTFGECVDFWWFLYGQHSAESLDLWTTLDYLWTTFLNLLVLILWSKMTRTRDTMGHPKALTKTSGTCSLESHLTKAKLSFSSSSNYLIHLDTISAFVSQMLRDLRVLEITGYHMMPWWFQGRSTSLQDTNSFHKLSCFYCPSCTVNVESLECCHPWLFTKLLISDKSLTKQFLPASDRSAGLVTSLAPRWCLVC